MPSPSVLVIRLDAIGDALALTPLLAAFRQIEIAVDLLLTERNRDVFSSRAARRIIVESPQMILKGYTHALVASEDARGYLIAKATQAPVRIGFDNGWGKPFKTLWTRSLLTQTIHRTAGLDARAPHECEVLFKLGSGMLQEDAVPTRNALELRPLVIDDEPPHDDRIAFQVSDKWERLGIAFGDVLSSARTLQASNAVRFFASTSEEIYADAFEREIGLPVERFETLAPWKEAIASARALVAPDSGAIHVAGMTGTPTVGIFAAQKHYERQIARWHPWAAPYGIIEASAGWPERIVPALTKVATR